MLDTDEGTASVSPPVTSATPDVTGADVRRWFDHPIRGGNRVLFREGLAVEWKMLDTATAEDEAVEAKLFWHDDGAVMTVHAPLSTKWCRISGSAPAPKAASNALVVQVLIHVDSFEGQQCWVEPKMASRGQDGGRHKVGIEGTAARLSLEAGRWYAVEGVFQVAGDNIADIDYDFLLLLSRGSRIKIAQLDVSTVPLGECAPDTGHLTAIKEFSAREVALIDDASRMDVTSPSDAVRSAGLALAAMPCNPVDLATQLILSQSLPWSGHFLRALITMMGFGGEFAQDAHKFSHTLSNDLVTSLLKCHLSQTLGTLSGADRLAFVHLAQYVADGGRLQAEPATPLHVQLTSSTPTEADAAFWQSLGDRDFVTLSSSKEDDTDLRSLSVAANVRVSPVTLAMLCTMPEAANGINLGAYQVNTQSTWRSKVVGFPSGEALVHVGTLSSGDGKASPNPPLPLAEYVTDRSLSQLPQSNVEMEHSYALVCLNGMSVQNASQLVNIENCIIFEAIDDVRKALDRLAYPDPNKPIIFLRPWAGDDEQYLLRAVARHWTYGGRYPVSPIQCRYLADSGAMDISVSSRDDISRFTLTGALASVPASEIRDGDFGSDYFIPSSGICITHAEQTLEAEAFHRLYRPAALAAADFEKLTANGDVDAQYINGLDSNIHWPIAHIISRHRRKYVQLVSQIRIALNRQDVSAYEMVFEALKDDSLDRFFLRDEIDRFLLAASLRNDILLEIRPSFLIDYLGYVRQSRHCDVIAQNIAPAADKFCQRDFAVIFPFFDLLAFSLDGLELSAVLAFCAARCAGAPDRYTFRIAECLRKFGEPVVQSLLLTSLAREAPAKLQKRELLRSFVPLINSYLKDSVVHQVGRDIVRAIEATAEGVDVIERNIRALERDDLVHNLQDPLKLSRINLYKWLHQLRGLSNELRELSIPIGTIGLEGLDRQPNQVLAAAIFSDKAVISDLYGKGLLDYNNDINAVARNIMGDNVMLNTVIARRFDDVDAQALTIEGDDVSQIFSNASRIEGTPSDDNRVVTVIMSAFNPDIPLMEIAAASVMQQSHRNVELIIVDDASNDDLAKEIKRIADSYEKCKLIRLDQNCGPYVGRNLAIEIATGEYIAIQDADDWAHPDRIRLQLAAFDAHPHARLLSSEHIRIDRAGKVQFEADFAIFGDGPMTSMFKKSVFDEVGTFSHVRSRGDVEMRERIRGFYGHHAITVLPLPLLLCLADSGTLSQRTLLNDGEHLQLFRSNIAKRNSLGAIKRTTDRLLEDNMILVPRKLRAPVPFKENAA